jgi:hypothetical protein
MNQEEFAKKWHKKIVVPIGKYEIPIKEYYVTAALYKYDPDDITVFAILGMDNSDWLTFKLTPEEVENLDKEFKVKEITP